MNEVKNNCDAIIALARRISEEAPDLPADFLFTGCQAAEYLGVDPSTISRYISLGKLSKVKRGRVTGIPFGELEAIKKSKP